MFIDCEFALSASLAAAASLTTPSVISAMSGSARIVPSPLTERSRSRAAGASPCSAATEPASGRASAASTNKPPSFVLIRVILHQRAAARAFSRAIAANARFAAVPATAATGNIR